MFSKFPWFTKYSERKLEYAISNYTLLMGIRVIWPDDSFVASAGLLDATRMMPEWMWGTLFVLIGWFHLYALHINGRASWTPLIRAWMIAANALVFFFLSGGYLKASPDSATFLTYLSIAVLFCGPAFISACRDIGKEKSIQRSIRL